MRTWNGKYHQEPSCTLCSPTSPTNSSSKTSPNQAPSSLSDHDLQAAYDHILEQFVRALLIGAHENPEWSDGKLVIAGNRANIHLLQAAFYAVTLEVQRRGLMVD